MSAVPAAHLTTVCSQVSARPRDSIPVPPKVSFAKERWYFWPRLRKVLASPDMPPALRSEPHSTSGFRPSSAPEAPPPLRGTLLLNRTDGNRRPQRQPPDPETFGSLGCAKDQSDKTEPEQRWGGRVAPGGFLPAPRTLAGHSYRSCRGRSLTWTPRAVIVHPGSSRTPASCLRDSERRSAAADRCCLGNLS